MLRLIVLVLIVLLAAAIYFLPWWSWLIILPAGAIGFWLARGWIVERVFTIPFRMKGKVLRNATADVHAVRPIPRPAPPAPVERRLEADDNESDDSAEDDFDDEDSEPVVWPRYFEIEVTITPKPSTGPFHLWAPHDLQLMSPRANPIRDTDDVCEVIDVNVHPPEGLSAEEAIEFEEGSKYPGPLRLTLIVGVKNDVRTLVFHYYLHKFGKVELPLAAAPH